MTFEIFILVLVSAAIHPFWNLIIKKDKNPERTYFLLGLGTVGLAFIHIWVTGLSFNLPPSVWGFIAISVLGQIIYGIALVSTYEKGDISIYYPIIRASPLFVIAVSFLFFGQTYEWYVLLGVLIVLVAGATLVIQPRQLVKFQPNILMLAVLAMCGTGIYSMSDAAASQLIPVPVLYFYVQIIFAFCYGLIMSLAGKLHFSSIFLPVEFPSVRRALLASVLMYSSYMFILHAYSIGGDVALVTTVRQISIPISVLMGGIWLRESGMLPRFVASGVLSIGIAIALIG